MNGGQSRHPREAAHRSQGSDGGQGRKSQRRVADRVSHHFQYVSRDIEKKPAAQPLKREHRILCQIYQEILEVLEQFEAASDPIHRLAGVRVCVIGGPVDRSARRIPIDADVLQEAGDHVVERKVDRRVVCHLGIGDTDGLQNVLEPLREPQRVVALDIAVQDVENVLLDTQRIVQELLDLLQRGGGRGLCVSVLTIGGAGSVCGADARAVPETT